MNNVEPNRPMNAAQVADYLGVAKSTVYQLPITYYAYGSRRVYDLKDVLEYKEKCRRVSTKVPLPVLKLTASSTTGATKLQNYFQKLGLRDSEGNRVRKIKSRS